MRSRKKETGQLTKPRKGTQPLTLLRPELGDQPRKYKRMLTVFGAILWCGQAMAHEFTWTNLMLASAKLQPSFDYEANVDSYMRLYRADVWNRYKNDEFELQDKRNDTVAIMKEAVSSFSLDEQFSINTSFEFGEYDFSKQVFPLDAVNSNSYYERSRNWVGSFPEDFQVFFGNPDKVGDISMAKDDAKRFLTSRKNSSGNVDRHVPAQLRFRIKKVRSIDSRHARLEAELTKVTIYHDRNHQKVLQEY